MKYDKRERETVILYNEAEDNASICTFNYKLRKKLEKMSVSYPDKVRLKEIAAHGNCVTYILPKTCIKVYPPYADNNTMSERAKSAEEK